MRRRCHWQLGLHCVVKTGQGSGVRYNHFKGTKLLAQHRVLEVAKAHATLDHWLTGRK